MRLPDTKLHPKLTRIFELLNQLRVEIDALPLESAQAHTVTQGGFHRFSAAFNGLQLVEEGTAVVIVNGLPTQTEVSNAAED